MNAIAGAIVGVVVFLATIAVGLLFAAATAVMMTPIVLIAWNVGVVAGADALGHSVNTIGFWGAYGIAMVTMVLRGIFSPVGQSPVGTVLKVVRDLFNKPAETSPPAGESREEYLERLRNLYGTR